MPGSHDAHGTKWATKMLSSPGLTLIKKEYDHVSLAMDICITIQHSIRWGRPTSIVQSANSFYAGRYCTKDTRSGAPNSHIAIPQGLRRLTVSCLSTPRNFESTPWNTDSPSLMRINRSMIVYPASNDPVTMSKCQSLSVMMRTRQNTQNVPNGNGLPGGPP